jgi:AcrR family transcriptional regulator
MAKKTKRPYHKSKRAEAEEDTRRRITEAAVQLHGTVGPASTKLTDVARLAGVTRMTVYNHFPTETDLFVACSTHWSGHHPFPDPERWRALANPAERLAQALDELYAWYDRNQGMMENVLRDSALVSAIRPIVKAWWGDYVDRVVGILGEGWGNAPVTGEALSASVRVVVDFHTWRVLTRSGLTEAAAADLAARMVSGVDVAIPR